MIRSAKVSLDSIPNHWQKKKIQDVALFIKAGGSLGYTKNQDYREEGTPAYSAAGQDGFVAECEFEQPGIVVSAIGARCGKCFLAEGKWTTLSNTQAIIVDESQIHTKFLWYLINDEDFWHKSGTAQPFIKPTDIHNSWIPVPPLAEQMAILSQLESMHTMILHHQKQLHKIDDLYKGMLEKLRNGDLFKNDGIKKRLKDVASLQMGQTIVSQQLVSEGIPVFSADTGIHPWGYIAKSKKVFHRGTIILSARGSIGFPRLPNLDRFISTQTTIAVVPNEDIVKAKFLHVWLQTLDYTMLQCTQAIPMITVGDLKEVFVTVPSWEKQNQVMDVFSQLSKIKDIHRALQSKHEQLLKELKYKILYGKTP